MSNLSSTLFEYINAFFKSVTAKKPPSIHHELEVKFDTFRKEDRDLKIKRLNLTDFNRIVNKLKSHGFRHKENEEEGVYMLRTSHLADVGKNKTRYIRTEVYGFNAVQSFCRENDLKKINKSFVSFMIKQPYYTKKENKTKEIYESIDFKDFNFKVSYNTEESFSYDSLTANTILNEWSNISKTFRYIHRYSFVHPDFPVQIDMSIVKSSRYAEKTTDDANLFSAMPSYEVEIEVDQNKFDENTTPEQLLKQIRMIIKYVMAGIQDTDYPISYREQNDVINKYITLIDVEPEQIPSNKLFIGPSPITLQTENILDNNNTTNVPNIRSGYTVTDKADGERRLLYIADNGLIYLIGTNMQVIFTGIKTANKNIFNSLLDGEIIYYDKKKKYINLYAAFDIYYINGKDYRSNVFSSNSKDVTSSRLNLMKDVVRNLSIKPIVKNSLDHMEVVVKTFYIKNDIKNDIFKACKSVLDTESRYITDGLIFTPSELGVGSGKKGEAGPKQKITWKQTFKWKPPQYNTIDFLVRTKKDNNNDDIVKQSQYSGVITDGGFDNSEYKVVILNCGANKTNIYPYDLVLKGETLKQEKYNKQEDTYEPIQFYPTNPYDENAGIANIAITSDKLMFTEEKEVFVDNTIVEFRYDIDKNEGWRWIPLRVRYDKTNELRQKIKNYGNSYTVANNNWHSIHNPITADMLSTGENIPSNIIDDDVYYNNNNNKREKSYTYNLRIYHNNIKNKLITSVSNKNDILIDYACGKAGDLSKWNNAHLKFVFGIDVSEDNIKNKLNGACARFLEQKQKKKITNLECLFVYGNSSQNIKSGDFSKVKLTQRIAKSVFGISEIEEEGEIEEGVVDNNIGKGVSNQFGIGKDGFNVSSCQFAIHYFFKDKTDLYNFIRNVSECTAVDGYFIGTCYDGESIFNKLRNLKKDENIFLEKDGTKIWEIVKKYDSTTFDADETSLGLTISVFQESINKMFDEYLVHFTYLVKVLEEFGFILLPDEDAQKIGFNSGSALFKYINDLTNEMGRGSNEEKISFLNRYFIFKKIKNVNTEDMV